MPTVSPDYNKLTPSEVPTEPIQMRLKCKACGEAGTYKVGRLFLDPGYVEEMRHDDPAESLRMLKSVRWAKWVSFTGYFLCAHCGAGGPWGFTSEAKRQMFEIMMRRMMLKTSDEVFIGQLTMFDGTAPRTGYAGVVHLQNLLAAEPTNAYLWNRLGNIFVGVDRPDLAVEPYEKAVELNPLDVESHHSLGAYLFDQGEFDRAVPHLNAVLRYCRTGTWFNERLKENVVEAALALVSLIRRRTQGRPQATLPNILVDQPAPNQGPLEFKFDFDLTNESDGLRLARLLLHGRPEEVSAVHSRWETGQPRPADLFSPAPPVVRPMKGRVGRNDPCPCGSGKKFKHCCIRR